MVRPLNSVITSPGCNLAFSAGLAQSTAAIIAPFALSRPRLSAISSVIGWMRAPIQPRSTFPLTLSCSIMGWASAAGIAKPMPI